MSGKRLFKELIPLEEALKICEAAAVPTDRTETVSISYATNRILAENIDSEIDVPSFDRSAMDGFAIRAEDVDSASQEHPIALRIVENILAGDAAGKSISSMECAEIATGGMLPENADSIILLEDTKRVSGNEVEILQPAIRGKHIITRGDDIKKGERVARAGELLAPSKIGAIAAIGREQFSIYRRPKITVMPTGDEIIRPGRKLNRGQIYDVNTFTLKSVIETFGGEAIIKPIVEDSEEGLLNAIAEEQDADMIIFSGGSSVGQKDLIADVIAKRGDLLFHGVAIKPGKPTIFGRVGKRLILGMPGHPTSCLSNAYIFLESIVRKIGRFPPRKESKLQLKLSEDIKSPRDKSQVLTVKKDGEWAVPVFRESSAITSMSNADGYVIIPPESEAVKRGTEVTVHLF